MKLKNNVFLLYSNRVDEVVSLWPGIGIIVIVVLLLIFPVREIFSIRSNLLSSGILTTATYIDKDIHRDGEGGTSYSLSYEYQIDDDVHQRIFNTNSRIYNRVEIGNTVEIRYLADNPDISRMVNELEQMPFAQYGWMLCGIIVLVVLAHIFWRGLLLDLRGELVYGELSHISGAWEEDEGGKDYVIKVSYNFIDPQTGESLYGDAKTDRNDLSHGSLPTLGTPVAIRYLNKDNFRLL